MGMPIWVVSSSDAVKLKIEAWDAEVNDYVMKSFNLEEFLAKVLDDEYGGTWGVLLKKLGSKSKYNPLLEIVAGMGYILHSAT
jgi:hypothetical protein